MDYENLPGGNGGASGMADGDQANLVSEIAAAASAAARTSGVPLLPDANGVVVLPAGATLDDIAVVGRDLVVTLDNGQVFVIPEGAIYVPQIVVDGVAVPPLNLAALLIGEQPIEPAAGLARSSGNNFFEPAGDIQPSFNIGDLLPPTEFTRAVENEEEVIPQAIDSQPTLVIVTPNAPAGGIDVSATVLESGLPARGAEPAGSNAAATTETTGGTIVFTSVDGIDSLTINGVAVTATGQTIVSPRGTLTITAIDLVNGTIGFTYTLTDNLVAGTVADQFTVVLTDNDGDTATSTLTVNATDDAPIARNDTDALAARSFAAELGNVITGAGTTSGAAGADTQGADGAAVTRIASNAIPANADTTFDGAGNLQVAGQYGTLLVRADGSYSYTRAAGTPGGVSDAFTYTLTDADGSASTATLTIVIADAAPVLVSIPGGGPGTVVAESGLPARPGEPAGSNAAANSETTTGTVTFNPGDGPATVTINGTQIAVGTVITTPSGTLTVTAFDPAAGTIGYSFTLTDNTAGDASNVTFTLVVTDQDGDSSTGTLAFAITDDAPLAVNDSATQATETAAVTVNVLANDTQGADGVANSAVAAVPGTLSGAGTLAYNGNGTFTYTPGAGEQGTVTFDYTITDGDGDTSRATVTITLPADSTPTISLAGDTSVDEAALGVRGEEPAGSNAASNDETAVGTISVATGGDTLASLVINGVNVTNGGTVTSAKGVLSITVANGVYSYSYTLSDNTLADPDSDTFNVVATDSDGDTATTSLVVTIADDAPTAANDSATQALENAAVTVNVLGNDTRGADGIANGAVAAVPDTLSGSGMLVYNGNGTFTYTPGAGEQGTVTFDYTITDGDGDTSRATVTIALLADSTPTISLAGDTSVDEAALGARPGEPAGSNAASNDETALGTISVATGGDTLASLVINGVDVTAGGSVTSAKGVLTVTVANGVYSYTYTLSDNTLADPDSDTFSVVATDSDGDVASTSLVVAIVDDVPTARADADSVSEDGPTVATGNVLTGIDITVTPDANATDGVADTAGADGAGIVSVVFNGNTFNPGTINGTYGSLLIAPSGGYRYTLNNANPLVQGLDGNDTLTETFTYTIRDGDGDTSTATLTITINGSDDGVTINGLNVPNGELAVNEANLADGSAPSAAALTQSSSFTVAGVDGLATIVVGGQTVFQNGAFVPGQTVATAIGTLTITNVVPLKDAAGDTVSATVSYSYTLTDNTLGHTGANGEALFDSFGVTVTDSDGSTASGTIDVQVRDDTPTAQFDSDSVTEDGPLVADGNLLTGIGGTDANNTDGVADVQGADGASVSGFARFDGVTMFPGTLGTPFVGLYGTLTVNADGSYVYTLDNANVSVQGLDGNDTLNELFNYTITDGDGDTSTANLLITIRGTDDAVTITGLNIAGGEETVFEANLADGSSPDAGALVQSGSFTVAGPDGLSSVTLNGFAILTSAGAFTPPPISNAGFGTLQITGATVVRDPGGDIISATFTYSYTLADNTLAHTGGNDAQLTDSFTVVVTDSDGSTASDTLDVVVIDDAPTARADIDSIGEDSAAPATGNVITGQDQGGLPDANMSDGVADTRGADGAVVTAVVFNPTGGGSVGGVVNGQTSGQYGMLSLGANGAYGYTLNSANPAVQGLDDGETLTETFTYTITDGDGDARSTTLTITINGANDAPVVGTAIARVSEEGLAGGIADGTGNVDTTDAASVTGTISISDPDGEPSTVTLGDPGAVLTADGQPVTWSGIGTATLIGSVGAIEVIRIAIGNTGAYTVTLSQSVDHLGLNQEDDANFLVPVSVSDGTVTVPTTLQIYIEDDSPIAADDGRTTIEGATALTGNVLGNDQAGADTPAAVSAVTGGTIGTPFAGTYGTLTLNADGSYTYTPNASVPSGSVDSFGYTMRDADGDTSTATLSFTFQGDANLPTAGMTTATVDDDALAGGNPGGIGDDDANPGGSEATFSGILPNSFGLDGPGKISFANLDGQSGAFGIETVQYSWNEAASTLTGTGPRGGLFTVVVDQASGAYTFTLLDNVLHEAGGNENNATNLTLSYQVIDSDGSIAVGTLAIDADDDTPTIDVTAGADAGVLLATRDAATVGAASDNATSTAQFGGVFALAASAGADGAAVAPVLSYALAVTSSASGLSSGGAAISLAQLIDGSVVGYTGAVAPVSENAATVVFSVKVGGDGTVTLTQFQQVDHAPEAPSTDAPFDDQFAILGDGRISLTASASITDGDGDTATDSVTVDLGGNIRFADDGPVLSNVAAGAGVTIDETSAGADFAGGPITATSATAAITATQAFGADGPAGGSATSYGLTVTGDGSTPLKTAIGDFAITLVQVDAQTVAGRYTDGTVKTAFTLSIGADGRVAVTQNVALEHNVDGGTAADYNDPLGLAGLVSASITITDRDGDTATASTAIGGNIVFLDDGVLTAPDGGTVPAGSAAIINGNVLGNDYRGADGSAITAVTNAGAGSAGVLAAGTFTIAGQYGVLTLNASTGAYTYARVPGAGGGSSDVFNYTLTDNDGDFSSTTLTINIGDLLPVATTAAAAVDDEGLAGGIAGAAANGDIDANAGDLDATSEAIFKGTLGGIAGDGINIFLFGATLTGTTQAMGQETVTYTVSADGSLLTATITASPDASRLATTLFSVKITDQSTGAYTVTLADNVLHANANQENDVDITVAYQLRDADLDLSTAGVLSIKFDDDTPTAGTVVAAVTTDDEGKGPFPGIEGGAGDVAGSPSVATGVAGTLFQPGADGLALLTVVGPPLVSAIRQGTASGNIGSAKQEAVNYTYTTAANGSVTVTGKGATSGDVAFVLVVNTDGSYSFTQSRALVQVGANESDIGLGFNITVTDADGDAKTGLLVVNVDDDSPIAFTPVGASATNTGTAVISGALDTVGNGIFDNAGADGIGSLTFASSINGTKLTGPSGVLQSGGADINLYIQANGSLIASTDTNPADGIAAGTTVFTATLNAATGQYTIDFDRTIDNGAGTRIADFSKAGAGNTPWKGVDADLVNGAAIAINDAADPNPDSTDLLFTPSTGGTINSDSDDIGISNQFIDSNEFVRVDLVQDLRFDPGKSTSDADGYLYDTHVGVSQFTFKVIQVQSNPNATGAVRIHASNVDDANALSQSNVGAAAINTAVNLDHTTVVVRNAAGTIVTAGVAVFDEGNDIVVTGVKEGYSVTFGAQANATFEAVQIENAVGDARPGGGTYAGDNFAIGGFAYSSVAIGTPVSFNLPVVLTDGDGDTSTGSIAVTVNPVVPVALDLDGDGVEFVGIGAGATFDYNGDGTFAATSWVGADDGILVLDANGSRTADGGAEVVFGGNGLTDLEGLAAGHDSNHDGVLSAADVDFAKFGVWQDANGNGVTDAGEFHTLTELGIASIGLVSDQQAYAAANGDVRVAGTASFTRADGSTGAVADAAFTAAPLERMAARAAEAAAGNAAAAGYLVAAAAAASALPVAAGEAPAMIVVAAASGGDAVQPTTDLHVERHDESAALTAEPAAKSAPAATGVHHAEPAPSASLGEVADHGSSPEHADAAPAEAVSAAPAPIVTDAAGGQLMEALLLAAQAPSTGGQHPQDVAAVLEAFGDSHGAALVDAVVDHFAGADAALPLGAGGNEALAGLLAGTVGTENGFVGGFDLTALLDDHGATAAAQV